MSNISELISAIVKSDNDFSGRWDLLALVIRLNEKGVPTGSSGYLYIGEHDFRSVAAGPFEIRPAMSLYLNEIYGEGPYPIKLLLQFDRNSGRFNIEFEDKNPNRWAVTPADIHGFIESLRPKFDQ
ncbi:MAG TPA: hypothetical protein PLH11_07175 [Gemmobacter sp.]|nr:hypothetical protein [Gemmobacter sp.]